MNFTYVITTPKDGMSGYRAEDGRWTGMTGNLKREEIDMGMFIRNFQDDSFTVSMIFLYLCLFSYTSFR